MTTTEVRAYAAGLFDGEGCVLLMPGPAEARHRIRLKVELVQVDPACLYWLQLHFGGRVYLRRERGSPRCRFAHRWNLCGPHAVEFLRLVRPYLLVKAAQADVAFEFYELVQAKGGIRVPISSVNAEQRERLRQQMKLLNHRGIA